MTTKRMFKSLILPLICLSLFYCSDNPPQDSNPITSQADASSYGQLGKKGKDTIIVVIESLPLGWKVEREYVFDHYVANSEFGIMPTEYRQFAGSSGDPNRIQKLNELKSKWGFNYIAACIGNTANVQAIVNAGYPKISNYLATGFALGGQEDRATVQNNDPFWGYYFDEPYSHTGFPHLTQSSFKSFRDFVKSIRPNSHFGFGETTRYTANFYTHNPYFWFGSYYTNNYPTSVDFVMCTRYVGYYNEADQRDLWTEMDNLYGSTFNRTWISSNLDGGEFVTLLGHAHNIGAAPWLYQMEDPNDLNDQTLESYCHCAWIQDVLTRYDKMYDVMYQCTLNHVHDPELCYWVEYSRTYLGMYEY